jgi:hypothetical protein
VREAAGWDGHAEGASCTEDRSRQAAERRCHDDQEEGGRAGHVEEGEDEEGAREKGTKKTRRE